MSQLAEQAVARTRKKRRLRRGTDRPSQRYLNTYIMETKPLYFVGSSRDDLIGFPVHVRKAAGHELRHVAKLKDAVYVLHVFQKKTRQTRREDIELAGRRYRQLRS
jgi:phage-related protein